MSAEQPKLHQESIEEKPSDLEKLDYVKANIDMPHVAPISKLVEKRFKEEGLEYNPEIIKDICYAFLEQGIDTSAIYTSEKHKASFPYAKFDTAKVAKILYEKYAKEGTQESQVEKNNPIEESDKEGGEDGAKGRKEFLFGSFQLVDHGNQFTFTEEVLHQIMKDLPAALDALKRGEEPTSNEVYILGSPTTLTGKMSTEFTEELRKDPYGAYGDIYAEFIASMMPKDEEERSKMDMLFYGISTGGSLATETARRLLEEKKVTQSQGGEHEERLPFLRVRIDTPPGVENKPGIKSKLKLAGGFIKEMAQEFIVDPYTRASIFGNTKYMKSVNKVLEGKGITTNMSPEQEKMKKEGIRLVIEGLAKGVPIPKSLKVTQVTGLDDWTTYSSMFNDSIERHREENPNTLGMHRKTEGNITSYGADMGHGIPFMRRKNEITRMARAVKSLQDL